MERICKAAPEWDSRVMVMQVVDSNDKTMQVRALMSSSNSGKSFDLRCKVREGLIAFVKREYPAYLPRLRGDLENQLRGVEDAPVPFTAHRAAR